MPAIAVTGADGFIGKSLCSTLESRGIDVIRIVRRREGAGKNRRAVDDLSTSELDSVLQGADTVIHLAGRAHVIREADDHAAVAFKKGNVDATVRMVEAAIRGGIGRFVFVSSIGVNGSETHGVPFTETDVPAPVEEYARSKLCAELSLAAAAKGYPMEWVIVRPPLVYGPGAPGNLARLLRLAASGRPLPLGSVRNRRNLIGLQNLCDFLALCAVHPRAAGELFLIAESESHSTVELLEVLARAMGRPSRVFAMPVSLLRLCASIAGKRREFDKLCGSLEVSSLKARTLLDWAPGTSFQAEVARTARSYMQSRGFV